jgi:hypothetical protein
VIAWQIAALLSAEGKLPFSFRSAFHNNQASEAMRSMSPSAERDIYLADLNVRPVAEINSIDISSYLLIGTPNQIQILK